MAKERKTKRKKLLADKRHSRITFPAPSEHYSLASEFVEPQTVAAQISPSKAILSPADYSHLITEVKKIAAVTGIVIAVEFGIYWTLKAI